ncbi:MAG: UDP-N-acetylmuramate dehydrogenase [Chlamydiota bacterium]
MLDPAVRERFAEMFGARVRFDEPLSTHTSMRVGGPADALVEVEGEEELGTLLALCASRRLPFLALGGGTNLIVRDGGFRGIAARLGGRLAEMEFGERGARAGGGAPLGTVVSEALRRGLAGLERLAGIPGTVGGAVRMNAGACGAEIAQAVAWARLVDGSGGARRVEGRAMGFEYRGCAAAGSAVVAEVGLSLSQGDPESLRAAAGECANRRAEWLPGEPNAGCIFKNPAGGPSAGELIDRLGLKGSHAGGAAVHARHANVIVNRGNATAADVLVLMQRMRAAVRGETGILLDPEVVIVGEDPAA